MCQNNNVHPPSATTHTQVSHLYQSWRETPATTKNMDWPPLFSLWLAAIHQSGQAEEISTAHHSNITPAQHDHQSKVLNQLGIIKKRVIQFASKATDKAHGWFCMKNHGLIHWWLLTQVWA